jgi:hypothetical protein
MAYGTTLSRSGQNGVKQSRPLGKYLVRKKLLEPDLVIPPPVGISTRAQSASMNFNGIDQYYTAPNNASLNLPNTDWTIAVLVKYDDESNLSISGLNQTFATFGPDQGLNSWRIFLNSGPSPRMYLRGGGASVTVIPTGINLNKEEWTVLVYRRTGTTVSVARCPVNGAVVNGTGTGTIAEATSPSGVAHFGASRVATPDQFLGSNMQWFLKVDGAALTDAQIVLLAAGQDAVTDLGLTPASYIRFNTNAATITDSGSGANVLTKVGSPILRGGADYTGMPIRIDTRYQTGFGRVYQRDIGKTTGTIGFSGTYTGSPLGLEARVTNGAAATPVTPWVRCATPIPGTWDVNISGIPQGFDLTLEVRYTNDPSIVARTPQPWGVGVVVLGAGQSNLEKMVSVTSTSRTINNRKMCVYDATRKAAGGTGFFRNSNIAATSNFGAGAGELLFQLQGALDANNIPVMFVNTGLGGTDLTGTGWKNILSSPWTRFNTACIDIGNKAEAIIWHQGENDAFLSTNTNYNTDLATVVGRIRAALGGGAEIPFFCWILGRVLTEHNSGWRVIRNAHKLVPSVIANSYSLGHAADHGIVTGDTIHYDTAGYARMGNRAAQAILNRLLPATYPTGMNCADPTSAVINGSNIDITFTLLSGTALQGLTGATGLTGFLVYGAARTVSGIVRTNFAVTGSVTRSGAVATVNSTAHGLVVNQPFFLSGASDALFQGIKTVATVIDANNFTFAVDTNAVTNPTGTIGITFLTVTCNGHGFATGEFCKLAGSTDPKFNVVYSPVLNLTANTFVTATEVPLVTNAPGASLTARKVINITTTAIPSNTVVRLTPASTPQVGWQVDYLARQNDPVTNQLYTNATVIGDTRGVPVKPFTDAITL